MESRPLANRLFVSLLFVKRELNQQPVRGGSNTRHSRIRIAIRTVRHNFRVFQVLINSNYINDPLIFISIERRNERRC